MRGRSRQLDQGYWFEDGRFVFDDGVEYSLKEALLLSRADDETVRAVHLIKETFDGELEGSTCKPPTEKLWSLGRVSAPATLPRRRREKRGYDQLALDFGLAG